MEVTVVRQTEDPSYVVSLGLQTCMKQTPGTIYLSTDQVDLLLSADHLSPLEHVSMTIMVRDVSRSFLAQVTRHRTFKFTSSSQHYQDSSNYPMVIQYDLYERAHTDLDTNKMIMGTLETAAVCYKTLMAQGIKREEARQFLPGAMAVNLLITADARNMINFFRQRRCLRNVEEMVIFADKWQSLAIQWFPIIFTKIGAPCFEGTKCTQGRLQADECRGGKSDA